MLIVNPRSRCGAREAPNAERALRASGVDCEVVHTTGAGDAARLARAKDHRTVFVLGGDGTAGEVLGAVAGCGTAVGLLPAGAGNLLARALGIPLDPARAAAALCVGEERRIDLGVLADGRHFAVAAGVGIDASMVARTSAELKRRAGVLAYVFRGLAAAFGAIREGPFRAAITVDGITHECDALSVIVANVGALFGGHITLAPDSRMDDAALDVCVYAPRGFPQAIRVAWRGWRGSFPPDSLTRFYRGARIRVSAEPAQRIQADGDLLGVEVLDARVAPGAGLVLVPAIR